jgi:hypothetical protein
MTFGSLARITPTDESKFFLSAAWTRTRRSFPLSFNIFLLLPCQCTCARTRSLLRNHTLALSKSLLLKIKQMKLFSFHHSCHSMGKRVKRVESNFWYCMSFVVNLNDKRLLKQHYEISLSKYCFIMSCRSHFLNIAFYFPSLFMGDVWRRCLMELHVGLCKWFKNDGWIIKEHKKLDESVVLLQTDIIIVLRISPEFLWKTKFS